MFAHEKIAFESNAGADDGRFVVVGEFRVMIQRHELWFVQAFGFSLGAYSSCVSLCANHPDAATITPLGRFYLPSTTTTASTKSKRL